MDKQFHLLKDQLVVRKEGFVELLRAAIQVLQSTESDFSLGKEEEKRARDLFFVKGKGRFYQRVEVSQVVCVQAEGPKVLIYVSQTAEKAQVGRPHVNYCSLADFMKQCNHPDILRVHRSYAVNINQVVARNERELQLSNGQIIPMSTTYRPQVQALLPLLRSQ